MSEEPGDDTSEESWIIDYSGRAEKDINRLDPPIRRRVFDALEKLSADPDSSKLRKLASRPESRLRVGDWRVLVELNPKAHTIVVKHVLPRGRAYDR